jgi:hypothetical protein
LEEALQGEAGAGKILASISGSIGAIGYAADTQIVVRGNYIGAMPPLRLSAARDLCNAKTVAARFVGRKFLFDSVIDLITA